MGTTECSRSKIVSLPTLLILVILLLAPTSAKYEEKPILEIVPADFIWYKSSNHTTTTKYTAKLDQFLDPYFDPKHGHNLEDCKLGRGASEGKVCKFTLGPYFAPCLPQYSYGFDSSIRGACIFLKLSQVARWSPEYFNLTNVPSQMPDFLQAYLKDALYRNKEQMVLVSCTGDTPADVENVGPTVYYPQRGFSGKYFPYRKIDGYLSPLVAVFFEQPRHGVVINVICKAWAPNISSNNLEPWTSINFALLVDY